MFENQKFSLEGLIFYQTIALYLMILGAVILAIFYEIINFGKYILNNPFQFSDLAGLTYIILIIGGGFYTYFLFDEIFLLKKGNKYLTIAYFIFFIIMFLSIFLSGSNEKIASYLLFFLLFFETGIILKDNYPKGVEKNV